MMKKCLPCYAPLFCLLLTGVSQASSWHHLNDVVLFDPGVPGTQGWEQPRGLTLSADTGSLRLSTQQPDSSIARRDLDLDPGMVEWLHVRYRASGFRATQTHGQLFYENAAHGFADAQYVLLPTLVTDGQWQDLWVNIPRSMRGTPSDWWDNGPVKALRLDLVDEAPGSIELAAVRLTAQRDDAPLPQQTCRLTHWQEPYGLTFQQRDGALALDILERDCRLYCADVPLDPAGARYLAIRYRAWDFADKQTTGQVFYANSRHGAEEAHCLRLPSLSTDGHWHDLVVDVAEALGRGYQDWVFGGPVTKLRLDLVDQAPGKAEVALVLAASRLRVTSEAELTLPAGRHYLLPASAFAPGGATPTPRPGVCALTLPTGRYSVWQRVVDVPQAYEALNRVVMAGVQPAPLATGGDTGGLTWVRLGRTVGGRLQIACPPDAGILLDAVLVAERETPPSDRPVAALQPVTSTVRPLTPRQTKLQQPYWQGSMLACPQTGEKDERLQAVRTVFRRNFDAPTDLASAWLQITVDDYFRLYLNGEKIAENLKSDSWMTPTLLDVTRRLRRGQVNCVAVEAYNVRGAQGVLCDLVINRPDHSFVRVVSDDKWRCSGEAPAGWTAPAFDDAAWPAPILQPGPPNAPWVVTIPYVNKVWEPPTRLLSLTARPAVVAGESQDFT